MNPRSSIKGEHGGCRNVAIWDPTPQALDQTGELLEACFLWFQMQSIVPGRPDSKVNISLQAVHRCPLDDSRKRWYSQARQGWKVAGQMRRYWQNMGLMTLSIHEENSNRILQRRKPRFQRLEQSASRSRETGGSSMPAHGSTW